MTQPQSFLTSKAMCRPDWSVWLPGRKKPISPTASLSASKWRWSGTLGRAPAVFRRTTRNEKGLSARFDRRHILGTPFSVVIACQARACPLSPERHPTFLLFSLLLFAESPAVFLAALHGALLLSLPCPPQHSPDPLHSDVSPPSVFRPLTACPPPHSIPRTSPHHVACPHSHCCWAQVSKDAVPEPRDCRIAGRVFPPKLRVT